MSRLGSKSLMQDLLVEYGSLLPKDFEAKAELSYNYTSSFKSDSMYGLWRMDQKNYSVYLAGDQTSNINEFFL
ncbi:hypothetical protein BDV23DRAFT_51442 [Aspergillus alliaceus]|uniref:Uncharacterized protein n=1 Tax=Petromyces alliaceus TaxID=209559 RepID=A0A5N7CF79_PETAA|nr:hypothetical protein BDV23DRAFT_51442 [Aspergillus alliaceus]